MIWTRLFPAVRKAERERFRFFFLLSGFLVLGQTLGLVGAESLLLANLGAAVLPLVFILASCVTVVASLLYAFGVDRARNDNYFVNLLLIFSGLIAAAAIASQFPSARQAALVSLFCLYYASFAVCTSHYWTFTGDFFDSIGAKRLFPLFTIGASLGGLVGGGIASLVATRPGGATELLWGWVASSLLAAVWLRRHRGPLRRWGPLEIEEADETSMDGMRSSLRFLRTSRLGKLLVLSALFMVTSLFVSQYLYSSLFVAEYPEPDELARFFGLFLAAANACELVLEVAVTPWLLSRFGIANANLFHPLLTVVSFGFLGFSPGLSAAIFARLNRETLENAVGQPVRTLLFNALPARLRGRMRAFIEGMVVYSGMALAGLFLLIWERMHPAQVGVSAVLCWAGFALACGFLLTNYGLKRDYLEQLIRAIREGRLELSHSLSTLETVPSRQLLQLWAGVVKSGTSQSILERLSQGLMERRLLEPLQESFAHGEARVRLVCLRALVQLGPVQADLYLRKALEDDSARVRLFAITHLPEESQGLARRALQDPDPEVRAEAARRCSPPELETLEKMLTSDDSAMRVAALRRVPIELLDHARTGLESGSPEEVRACLSVLCQHDQPPAVSKLEELFSSPSPGVRVEVISAAVRSAEPAPEGALKLLYQGLSDNDRHVRRTAAARFALAGSQARPILTDALSSPVSHICHNAISALATWGDEEVTSLFGLESIRRAKRAWTHSVEAARLRAEPNPDAPKRFLILALEDSAARDLTACFRLLEVLEEEKIVRSVEKVLRFAHARIRADALEVLSNLGVRESTSILVHLLEEGDIVEREHALTGKVPPPPGLEALVSGLKASPDRWLALAAESYQRSQNGAGSTPGSEDSVREETVLMEHLLMLRNVPLFSSMTLEQLEAIHHCLSEQHYTAGETIFNEGDVGDEMYIVLEGEVDILIKLDTPNPIHLTSVGPDSYFGEMSVLDNEPRSAAARTSKESRLLMLKGEQLKELVYIMPEIAFTIFKVLSERLRRSDKRLDTLTRDQEPEGASEPSETKK